MKRLFFFIPLILSTTLILTTQSCYYDNEEELYPTNTTTTTTCDTTNAKFATFVKPLMDTKCASAGCHNAGAASAGANLSSHTGIKNYITSQKAAFLGSIKHSNAYSSMPKGASKLPDCDIKKLEVWINAGMQNN
jgi:cytochrome c553